MLRAGWHGFFPLLVVEILFGAIVYLAALVTFPLLGIGAAVAAVLLSMAGPVVVIEGGITQAFARSFATREAPLLARPAHRGGRVPDRDAARVGARGAGAHP